MNKWFEDKERFFWILHTGGWAGFVLVYYLGSFLHDMRAVFVLVIVLNGIAGWLLTIPLRYLYRRIWDFQPLALIGSMLLASYLIALVWTVIKNLHYWEIYKFGYVPEDWIYYFTNSLASFYIIFSWSGLYFGIKYYQMLQAEKRNVLKASSMAHQAHLKMLRYQLNPHFLFNTLNAISTLILVKENDTANKMVSRLSDFLRYSLDKDPIKTVTLKQEVQVESLYLDIEKVRFDDRLTVHFAIDPEVENALVPSMLLQPLIENSIKYAIAASEQGGTIWISANAFGKDVLIEVADNGPGVNLDESSMYRSKGVGLPNIKERLQSLYGDNYSFDIAKNQPTGVKVRIRLPFQEKKRGKEN
ncbi:histidine kinase [Neptunicella marina]|uniref:histidine kinase n=1 Tax=Neptunicella marina TaxID=2125989 RepID=A0A8J6IRS9_9ALTE|nr:histidine kinase [Neptunicella marina]